MYKEYPYCRVLDVEPFIPCGTWRWQGKEAASSAVCSKSDGAAAGVTGMCVATFITSRSVGRGVPPNWFWWW